ncbi:hypothetical protein NGA88_10755, partial [Streptococcus suis]|uniref:hypothetical protein n=1 Tax=Streptococcus suis TaxID=1307 RepID=UPI00207CE980
EISSPARKIRTLASFSTVTQPVHEPLKKYDPPSVIIKPSYEIFNSVVGSADHSIHDELQSDEVLLIEVVAKLV